jgi:glyoxylase-like metal-dependent hydrolase (beta-lactamase superfamily II)
MTAEGGREVLAVRYGTVMTTRSGTFDHYEQYGEADAPLRMDYFFWVIRSATSTVLVDTGFGAEVGRRRGRTCLIDPVDALAGLGISPGDVDHIVVSHFHYDHIGNLAAFPTAVLTVARTELSFWTDPHTPPGAACGALVEQAEIACLTAAVRQGRVQIVEAGDAEVVPGVRVRLVGGHTPGQLVTSVQGDRGRVVLASDAVHFDEEMRLDRPHRLVHDEPAMRAAYAWLRAQQDAGALVIAGHDPAVMDRFPVIAPLGAGSAVRLSP